MQFHTVSRTKQCYRSARFQLKKGYFWMETIKVYTTSWCPDCHMAKRFLKSNDIPFEEVNIETTPGAAAFVMNVNNGKRSVPTFDVGGRTFNCSPYSEEKMRRGLGL